MYIDVVSRSTSPATAGRGSCPQCTGGRSSAECRVPRAQGDGFLFELLQRELLDNEKSYAICINGFDMLCRSMQMPLMDEEASARPRTQRLGSQNRVSRMRMPETEHTPGTDVDVE
eukprot:gnl/TRDRNA2_/TRDRNA2_177186_c2_seq1.p2 gnl/TRDRNA2_/TRDRNA2_177186_c2~~gnl/TRDRNA2_/TRDRNA2_177186_c2_seq1.p2  ORF type:complete len:116 (+),score=15.54 gnl/TRDRNA2_/TRDRNA2_177186_c2_seq1:2-349(+)